MIRIRVRIRLDFKVLDVILTVLYKCPFIVRFLLFCERWHRVEYVFLFRSWQLNGELFWVR